MPCPESRQAMLMDWMHNISGGIYLVIINAALLQLKLNLVYPEKIMSILSQKFLP